jgi:hypothetical protein
MALPGDWRESGVLMSRCLVYLWRACAMLPERNIEYYQRKEVSARRWHVIS